MIEHLFVLAELLFFSSLLVRLPGGPFFSSFLFFLAALYFLADNLLSARFNLRLRPILLPHFLHPASFLSSARKIGPTPFAARAAILLASSALWLLLSSFLTLVSPLYFLASALIIFPCIGKKPACTNPLFLAQWEWLSSSRTKKTTTPPPSISEGPKLFHIHLSPQEKPHILFVFLESFRAKNVGALQAKQSLTPHFDALAQRGALFTQFHATSNLTCRAIIASLFGAPPSPKSWYLGRYADMPLLGIPKILNPLGYHSAVLQGGHLSFDNGIEFFQKQGFQTLIGKREIELASKISAETSWGVHDEHLMPFAASWLEKQTQPTFLSLFTITNHHPWTVPSSFKAAHESPYFNTLAYTDWALHLLIEDLKRKNLLEKSILFIFGDHGQELEDRSPFFEVNQNLYQDTLHVPLLILAEGRLEKKRINTLSSQIDLVPTLLDLLQISAPHHPFGKSLLRESRIPIYFSHPFESSIRGCRQDNWKLILKKEKAELYDLDKDPEETQNISAQNLPLVEELIAKTVDYFSAVEYFYDTLPSAKKESPPSSETLHLDLSASIRVTDAELEAIARSHPNLLSLSLSHCLLVTDTGIRALLQHCPRLEKLNLQGLDDITGENWPPSPNLMHLKAIDCPNLSAPSWTVWLENLSSLRILQLGAPLLPTLKAANLWTLHLAGMERIDNEALTALFKANPHLTILSIENCPQIEDAPIRALAQTRTLKCLHLSNCPLLTDSALESLTHTPVQQIVLQNCPQISQKAIDSLQNSPDREVLFLSF